MFIFRSVCNIRMNENIMVGTAFSRLKNQVLRIIIGWEKKFEYRNIITVLILVRAKSEVVFQYKVSVRRGWWRRTGVYGYKS